MAYPMVSEKQVTRLIGKEMQADLPLVQLVDEVKEKFHVYFIIPGGASHGRDPKIMQFWESTFGPERVIVLQDPSETSECIALTIGMNEGAIDLPAAKQQLEKRDVVGRAVESIIGALSSLFAASKNTARADRDRRL